MHTPASIRHLKIAGSLVLGVIVLGTTGYCLIEHLSLVDALYTTINMMASIGGVVHPVSAPGRIFSIFVISFGVGSLLYTLTVGMEFMIEGHLSQVLRRQRMESKIAKLRDHSIICGFGRVGSQIAADCVAARKLFVVIDDKEHNTQACLQRGYLVIQGDATNDDVLHEAGVERAQCVLVATDSDAYNISITLSARHLNANLLLVARANRHETEAKLQRAGANRVISPYALGGHCMANLTFQAGIVEFFDLVTQAGSMELALQELVITEASVLSGVEIARAYAALERGIVIIALKKRHGTMTVPRRKACIEQGDTLILLGLPEQLTRFTQAQQ